MPVTIVGMPFSMSSTSWIGAAIHRGENSTRKIAVSTPIGTAIPVAIARMSAEPTIALEIPPWPPKSDGARMKRCNDSAGPAFTATEVTTSASTPIASTAAPVPTPSITRFTSLRRRTRPVARTDISGTAAISAFPAADRNDGRSPGRPNS